MNSFQARLVLTDEQNPKGKVVGRFKIENGEFSLCGSVKWLPIDSHIPIRFTSLEPLAPFKDKDGGDLYSGDLVEQRIARGVLTFNQEDTRYCWSIRDDDNFEVWCVLWAQPITKLGTIHD